MKKKALNQKKCSFVEQVMDLTFFARRFCLPKKDLNWGILVAQNEDAEVNITPIIIIGGGVFYIDIVNDCISPLICACGCKCTTIVAQMQKVANGYIFEACQERILLKDETIQSAFRGKFYTEELEEEAKRLRK